MAQDGLKKAIRVALKVVSDQPLRPEDRAAIAAAGAADAPTERRPKYSIEDKMRAAEFLRRCAGIDRAPALREGKTHFGVLRRSEAEAGKVVGK